VKIPIYRTVELNPDGIEKYSVPRYRLSLVKEAEIDWPKRHINGPTDAYELAKAIFEGYDRESMFVFMLDRKSSLIGINLVAIGTLTEALVHPRELFKAIILANAAAFIMVHNHPSGDPTPSRQDRVITDQVKAVSDLIGVQMLDSMVVGETGFYSYAESGVLSAMGQRVIRVGEKGELKWPAENPEKFVFYRTCVDWSQREAEAKGGLIDMIDNAREITRATFVKHVDRDSLKDIEEGLGYVRGSMPRHMADDYAVSYHKSKLFGRTVYYFRHSAIEYIFVNPRLEMPNPKSETVFWGRCGAGILFHCPEDGTFMLTLRSGDVQNGGLLGIPGGACGEEGFFSPEQGRSITQKKAMECAIREVIEELGWFPHEYQAVAQTLFQSGKFQYRTFVLAVPPEEKERSLKTSSLNWENDAIEWLTEEQIASRWDRLHFGVQFAFKQLALLGG